jgi:spore coat polysaccharide biosynthesis protein SpsF
MPKAGIIIQARTGSTRLPGKILLPFLGDDSILDIIIRKLLPYKNKFPLILATSNDEKDKVLKSYSDKYDIMFFAGSEDNVLERFVQAGKAYKLDNIIRICSDNPFLETKYLDILLARLEEKKEFDYCSFKTSKGLPVIKSHLGLFVEIVSTSALEKALNETNDSFYFEHVTNYIYVNPEMFKVVLIDAPELVFEREDLRFTVDNESDFENMARLYGTATSKDWEIEDVILQIEQNKSIKNSMITNIKKYTK